ncbi:VPLPA-CTERM sorting domain-containing protein [Methylomonas sp. EFPC3]|uniref:VPLPA-CTERM sorting domain-containing protein n=1 Tax=Methylomonas sp. EFPC3 TaxID=3021710 RepID=UPI0024160CA2|nr:VPLPA-CTERM sorting domain-containing protein [Methylomonas sp. EFPC3]WFP48572.1 VPLPA-CTERM sorting domain-containing protein [Methylomonas sp. EFPC3]
MKIYPTNLKHLAAALALATASSAQADLPSGTIGGMAYFTYDQATWATMRSSAMRSDSHGIDLKNTPDPTSDTDGNRFFYPQLFRDYRQSAPTTVSTMASDDHIVKGTADPKAVEEWRIFDLAQRKPLDQPEGGFAMPVDPIESGLPIDWGSGYSQTRYDPNPTNDSDRVRTVIGLGGSFRMVSDFFGQSGSLWFSGLELREQINTYDDSNNYYWYIASTHPQAPATIFELINPVFDVNAQGQMTLEADYRWGTSAWGAFFQFRNVDGTVSEDGNKVLGHLSINPNRSGSGVSSVPLPATAWLFGSALLGLIGIKRRAISI